MASELDGEKLESWVELAKRAASAPDADAVRALSEEMDGWPTIIDVEGYGEDDSLTQAFDDAVAVLCEREEASSGELAEELNILVSTLTAT